VSQLRKCIKIPTEIIDSQAIKIEPDLTYTEHPLRVLDTKERSTRRETIRMFKIQWNHHTEEEATWETESYLLPSQPSDLIIQFYPIPESRDEILFRGKAVTLR
jgi:hypothetical protein